MSQVSELKKLAELFQSGVLTAQEFTAAKRRLLQLDASAHGGEAAHHTSDENTQPHLPTASPPFAARSPSDCRAPDSAAEPRSFPLDPAVHREGVAEPPVEDAEPWYGVARPAVDPKRTVRGGEHTAAGRAWNRQPRHVQIVAIAAAVIVLLSTWYVLAVRDPCASYLREATAALDALKRR
jgi:hypothetical protein